MHVLLNYLKTRRVAPLITYPNGPELLESLKLRGGGAIGPPSELSYYNKDADYICGLYNVMSDLIQLDAIKPQ